VAATGNVEFGKSWPWSRPPPGGSGSPSPSSRLAYDGALLGAVGRIVVDSVLGFYRRRMRDEAGAVGRSGAVSVVQRASADLRLNPHWHVIFLDGVFAPDGQGALVFHQLRNLDNSPLADLLQVIRVRVLGYLERRGVIENRAELTVLDGDFCEREPALAQLAAAAVSGLTPAGPEQRCRPPIALRGQLGVQVSAALSVAELGFSLHAATCASADDARGREALVRYALRPPIAQERLHLLANDLVRVELRRPFRDGTVAVDLDPLSWHGRDSNRHPPRSSASATSSRLVPRTRRSSPGEIRSIVAREPRGSGDPPA
jgi:hypothetical protein